jgi:hypothetical protein
MAEAVNRQTRQPEIALKVQMGHFEIEVRVIEAKKRIIYIEMVISKVVLYHAQNVLQTLWILLLAHSWLQELQI